MNADRKKDLKTDLEVGKSSMKQEKNQEIVVSHRPSKENFQRTVLSTEKNKMLLEI